MDKIEEGLKSSQLNQIVKPALLIEDRSKILSSYNPKIKDRFIERFGKRARPSLSCTSEKIYRILAAKFPIIEWLPGYRLKEWLLPDTIAGLTVAIMQIPHGIALALLCKVPPICGLYMAFFQTLMYAFLGTSRQMSVGTFAVACLMTGKVVEQLATFPNDENEGIHMAAIDPLDLTLSNATKFNSPIQVATAVTLMMGIWQMLMWVFQMGCLNVFLSEMLVSGLTTGAAFHVMTSQIKDLFGIPIPSYSGPLKIIYVYRSVFTTLNRSNVASITISSVTILVLVFNNEILKPLTAKWSRIPLPMELIVVILGTVASFYGELETKFSIDTVGIIPRGLPPVTLPQIELLKHVVWDSLVMAIVCCFVTISLAKIFASKHLYSIDSAQELFAQGMINMGSSFLSCPPCSGSLARTLIQDAVGGVTQMASFVCCFGILLVLLFIGPLFSALPNAIPAATLVVSLKGLLLQVKDVVVMWSASRTEALLWLVTFFSVVIIDIDYGLVIGIAFSLLLLLVRNQRIQVEKLGKVPDSDIYADINSYSQLKEPEGMCLLRIVGPIHFANRENFRKKVVSLSGINPNVLSKNEDVASCEVEEPCFCIILDMAGVNYIDVSGRKFIEELRSEYEKIGVTLCLAGISESKMKDSRLHASLSTFKRHHLFHSLDDAIAIHSAKAKDTPQTY